ncbi:hypothetical protein [Ornithinimicrobium sediminis]|uniref:hypothetical protein n=1 Tax=Ornithinimicrobium sediminis TaxID=2904603 RepID=UPI001E318000|nr:hypothetical protein [Ornithinimicrobium sediminis]MCE0488307.1 hypothetical protein [Ornithinimicrobium sediminis]
MELIAEDLSVVLLGDGAVGDEILAASAAWARAGLLRPSVWLRPSAVDHSLPGPARVTGVHVSAEGLESNDLFTLVGLHRLSWVRFVVVHLSESEHSEQLLLDDAASVVAEALKAVLPLATGEDDLGTHLHKVKLVVPASGVTDLSDSILRPDWEVNVVVSPEDRPDVDRASIFVRHDENYVGHAVNAICATAGLWLGVPSGAVDTLNSDSTTSQGDLYVMRPTVRAVIGADRVEQLAARVLATIADSGVVDYLDWAHPAAKPTDMTTAATERILSSHNWVRPPTRFPVRDGAERRGAADVASGAVVYNLRLFKSGWGWMVRRGERSVERRLTTQLVGEGTDISVALRPHDPPHLVALSDEQFSQAERTLGELLQDEGLESDAPLAETWRDLRRVALALIDGGPLPDAIRPEGSSSLVDVVPPHMVVPEPDDTLRIEDNLIGIVDVLELHRHKYRVPEDRQEQPAESQAGGSPQEDQMDAERNQKGEAADRKHSTGGARPADMRGDLESTNVADAEPAAPTRRQVQAWVERRRGTLLWMMADEVAGRLSAAQDKRAKLEATEEHMGGKAVETLRAAYRRLLLGWRSAVAFIVVAVAVLTGLVVTDTLTWQEGLTWLGVVVIVFIGLVAFANHRYFKADLRYRKQTLDAIHQRRHMAEELVNARRDVTWWENRYRGLMLWAPILAEVVHRPWAPLNPREPDLDPAEVERLPAAVALARSAEPGNEDFGTQVLTRAVNVLCPPGFLEQQWDDAFDVFISETRRSRGQAAALIDADQLTNKASPRRELHAFLRDGRPRAEASLKYVRQLREAVDRQDVRLAPLLVKRQGQFSDGHEIPDEDFYRVSLRSATPFVIDFWTPDGQLRSKHLLDRSLVWLPVHDTSGLPSVDVGRAMGRIAMRVDLSGRCSASHVEAFTHAGAKSKVEGAKVEAEDDPNVWN